MHKLYKKAKEAAKSMYREQPSFEDDIMAFEKDLELYLSNLIDYHAHLVQKQPEAVFSEKFYSSISEVEVVVISDWKMKILASKYREAMQEWFSKRGISLLGFEIHFKSEGETKQVLYHFFLTDDTTQDTEAVICAKHFLYTKVLPAYGIKKVKFQSDGAACYSSKEAKACMVLFGDLSKRTDAAYETSYKVSVAGCGKTQLDVSYYYYFSTLLFFFIKLPTYNKNSFYHHGMFGVLTMHLGRLVNYGHSYQNAEDLFNMLSNFPLQYSFFHLFKPMRNKLPIPTPNDKASLSNFHLIRFDATKGIAKGRYHSEFSIDQIFETHQTEGLRKEPKRGRKKNKKCK